MIVFANAKVATQQSKAAIEGALKLDIETRAWGSDSDIASIFYKIIHNFRNDISFFATSFALVRAICATVAYICVLPNNWLFRS